MVLEECGLCGEWLAARGFCFTQIYIYVMNLFGVILVHRRWNLDMATSFRKSPKAGEPYVFFGTLWTKAHFSRTGYLLP